VAFCSAPAVAPEQELSHLAENHRSIVLSLLALAAVVVAGSSGFNAIVLYHVRHSPPGQTLLVGGHEMRIDCRGSGSPTIVLDAGLGNDGLIWVACNRCSPGRRASAPTTGPGSAGAKRCPLRATPIILPRNCMGYWLRLT